MRYVAAAVLGLASLIVGAWGMRSISVNGATAWWTVMPGIAGLGIAWWIMASESAISRWAAILLMGILGTFFYGLAGYSYYQLQRRGGHWGSDDSFLVGTAVLCGLALLLTVVVSVRVRSVSQVVVTTILSGTFAALVSLLAVSAWFDFNPYRGGRWSYPLATLIGAAGIFVAAFFLSAFHLTSAVMARRGEELAGPDAGALSGEARPHRI